MKMKKNILLLVVVTMFVTSINAQLPETMYVASKQGLSVYEKPFSTAKIVGKVAYGQKIIAIDWDGEEYKKYGDSIKQTITEEGLDGYWLMIKYNNKKAYIINTFLLPVAPPKKGVTTMEQYFKQLSPIAGIAQVKRYVDRTDKYSKTLFKNGMEVYITDWSEVYTLHNFSVQ